MIVRRHWGKSYDSLKHIRRTPRVTLEVREGMELWGWLFPTRAVLQFLIDCFRSKAKTSRLENRIS